MVFEQHDLPADQLDLVLFAQAAGEPAFDSVVSDFLHDGHAELINHCREDSLVRVRSFGFEVPWLYRLDYRTRGLVKGADGRIVTADHHSIILRFLPDCLRHTDHFQMIQYAAPCEPPPFHPNICPRTGAICLQIFAGETVSDVVASLHDLLRWRIRQLREEDSLNGEACVYGRTFVDKPLDDRPLFGGAPWNLRLESREGTP
jgi:hypothetical protein